MADVTIKVCDRCKKTIEDRSGLAVFQPVFIRSIFRLDLFRNHPYFGRDRFKQFNVDLCENCSNELVWFLEGAPLDVSKPEETTEEVKEE